MNLFRFALSCSLMQHGYKRLICQNEPVATTIEKRLQVDTRGMWSIDNPRTYVQYNQHIKIYQKRSLTTQNRMHTYNVLVRKEG